jgi:prolycopene isomerase
MQNFVNIMDKPFTPDRLFEGYAEPEKQVMHASMHCRLCEYPSCTKGNGSDIRGIMRRVSAGNFTGARKVWLKHPVDPAGLAQYEADCIWAKEGGQPVAIRQVINFLDGVNA